MRYRMYTSVNEGLKIEVLYGDKHVAQSPYILKGKGFLFFVLVVSYFMLIAMTAILWNIF